jgi:hypothetical protein
MFDFLRRHSAAPASPFGEAALERRLAREAGTYRDARPFPHLVVDGFLPAPSAQRLLAEFPPPEAMECEDSPGEDRRLGKYRSDERSGLREFTLAFLRYLSSPPFLRVLEQLTAIPDLVPDPDVARALRHFRTGGRLEIHVDPSWHGHLGMHRRLNLLYYLNEGWRPEWNGALELWDYDSARCEVAIEPRFNRAVVFPSTDRTLHGFPAPLRCPPDVTRKSLQLYYYTATRPAGEADSVHGTIFR